MGDCRGRVREGGHLVASGIVQMYETSRFTSVLTHTNINYFIQSSLSIHHARQSNISFNISQGSGSILNCFQIDCEISENMIMEDFDFSYNIDLELRSN